MAKRANNEGTIYKKTIIKNGKEYSYWEAQVTIGYDPGDGKRIRKTFTGKTQKEVRAKMQQASVDLDKKEYLEPSTATLSQWLDTWIDEYCNNLRYNTLRQYKSQGNLHIKPYIGNIKLCELSPHHIQHLYSVLSKGTKGRKPLSPTSIENIHHEITRCLNVAISIGLLKENPCSNVSPPKKQNREIHPLTDDQILSFLSEIEKTPYSNLLKIILFLGLRRSEALGITWDCVDFKTNIITINKQLIYRTKADGGYTFAPTKNGKARYLSAPKFVMDTLSDQKLIQDAQKENSGEFWLGYTTDKERELSLVFTTDIGGPLPFSTLGIKFRELMRSLDLERFRIHDLRHTYTVLSLRNGDDIKTIQENLGHATATFTLDVYGHATEQMKRNAADNMQRYISSLSKTQTK